MKDQGIDRYSLWCGGAPAAFIVAPRTPYLDTVDMVKLERNSFVTCSDWRKPRGVQLALMGVKHFNHWAAWR